MGGSRRSAPVSDGSRIRSSDAASRRHRLATPGSGSEASAPPRLAASSVPERSTASHRATGSQVTTGTGPAARPGISRRRLMSRRCQARSSAWGGRSRSAQSSFERRKEFGRLRVRDLAGRPAEGGELPSPAVDHGCRERRILVVGEVLERRASRPTPRPGTASERTGAGSPAPPPTRSAAVADQAGAALARRAVADLVVVLRGSRRSGAPAGRRAAGHARAAGRARPAPCVDERIAQRRARGRSRPPKSA